PPRGGAKRPKIIGSWGSQPRRYSGSRLCPGGTVLGSNWRRPGVRSSIGSSLLWRILQTIYCTISACHERSQSPPEHDSDVSPRAVCSIERLSTRSSTRASSVISVFGRALRVSDRTGKLAALQAFRQHVVSG